MTKITKKIYNKYSGKEEDATLEVSELHISFGGESFFLVKELLNNSNYCTTTNFISTVDIEKIKKILEKSIGGE
jgi:hypothetical protein